MDTTSDGLWYIWDTTLAHGFRKENTDMATYNVIIKQARTGEERIVDVIKANNQVEAKKITVRKWFTSVNMMEELLMVVRK